MTQFIYFEIVFLFLSFASFKLVRLYRSVCYTDSNHVWYFYISESYTDICGIYIIIQHCLLTRLVIIDIHDDIVWTYGIFILLFTYVHIDILCSFFDRIFFISSYWPQVTLTLYVTSFGLFTLSHAIADRCSHVLVHYTCLIVNRLHNSLQFIYLPYIAHPYLFTWLIKCYILNVYVFNLIYVSCLSSAQLVAYA